VKIVKSAFNVICQGLRGQDWKWRWIHNSCNIISWVFCPNSSVESTVQVQGRLRSPTRSLTQRHAHVNVCRSPSCCMEYMSTIDKKCT
jgi:hypothetical protein